MVGSEPHHHHHQQHHQNHQQQQQQQRSKEALGMVALHEALRTVCLNTDWTYSVFWSIRPRPYVSLYLLLTFSSSLSLTMSFWPSGEFEAVATAARSATTMEACKLHLLLVLFTLVNGQDLSYFSFSLFEA